MKMMYRGCHIAFELFPWLRRFDKTFSVTPNDFADSSWVWHESSASNAFNSESSEMFSFPLPCRSSTSKSQLLKRRNHSRHVFSLRTELPLDVCILSGRMSQIQFDSPYLSDRIFSIRSAA